jgi:DNA invertase Pin-like site-specific DNA recombinase
MTRRVDPSKAVAYLRVSTDEQHLGPAAQRAAIEAWAARKGVTIDSWHEDTDHGGALGIEQRPGLSSAMTALKGSRARYMLVAKRDRLARDVELAGFLDGKARACGAIVVTADGLGEQQTMADHLTARMMDVFAEYERGLIRERTRNALAVKRRRGERVSRHPPYGFSLDDGRLVPHEGERATIVRIAVLAAEGLSLMKIATALERAGHLSRAPGGRWHKTTIDRLVRRLNTTT